MQTYIPQPPSLKGDERAQLEQMYRYLYKMSEQLNSALAVTDREYQIVVQTKSGSAPGSESPISPQLDAQYRELRSLIIKTADIVNQQMDKTIKQLNGKFEAISSEWGTFEQNIERKIVETAEATIDSFDYSEKIHGIEKTVLDGVTSYAIESLGYIKRGIIGFDDENFPIYGIAVGTELKEKTVEKDGKTYQQIDTTKRIATYTSDAITFWRNDVAIARFSGDELYVTRAEITQQIRLGDWFFSVAESGGLNISKRLGSAIDISENGTITSIVGNINEANTSISQTRNDITALAKRTSAAEDKISSTESKLELKADSATLKVVRETAEGAKSAADAAQSTADGNASSITALTTRVESAEQKITADAIVSTVTSSTSYKTLSSTAEAAKKSIDGLNIGGRNYIVKSEGPLSVTNDGSGKVVSKLLNAASKEKAVSLFGQTVTVSFDWSHTVTEGTATLLFNYKYNVVFDFNSSEPSKGHYENTFVLAALNLIPTWADENVIYLQGVFAGAVTLTNVKVEVGNKPTDWSPAPEDVNAALNQQAAEFANIVTRIDGDLSSLQSQVDGSITTWFYEVAPTLENVPAKDWTTEDDKNVHLGDLYYDTVTGYCYRWQVQNKVYGWQRITDTDVTKALADAKNAQDTADGKRRVFVVEPTPPYDVGDVWMQGADGDILRCQTKKIEGQSYAAADWVKGSKYTNDDKANEAMTKANANAEAIETNRSELTLTKNSLTALVERTTAVEDRVTTAESKIDQKADSITLSVLETKVDGISIGGRNLLLGTEQPITTPAGNNTVNQTTYLYYTTTNSRPQAKEAIVFSCDVQASSGATGKFLLQYTDANNHYRGISPELNAADYTTKKHVVYTIGNPYLAFAVMFIRRDNATGTITISKAKLEKGNKATDWSPAPEDPAGALSVNSDYSKVDINTERVRIVSKRMEVAVPSEDGEDDVLRVDRDGVHAEVVDADMIVSDSVVHTQGKVSYTPANAGELAAILEGLNGKCLTGDVDVNCINVSSGSFEVQGLCGAAGKLTLRNGALNALTVRGCGRNVIVYVESMEFSTSGVAVTVDDGAVMLLECSLNASTGLRLGANWPSEAWLSDCEGDCTTLAALSSFSRLWASGSKPTGTLTLAAGSEAYNSTDDPTFAAKPAPSIPTTQTVTVSLSPTSTSTSGYGSKLYQGRYSSSQSLRKGVMLFTLPSDLTSADKIDSATLTIKRIGGVGQGGGVSVHVRCYDVTGTLYASKTAYENQTVSIDVTAAVKAMKTNGYTGLMLYNPDTTTVGGKSYTASYSRFAGKGESGEPVLKISYRK